MIIKEIKIKNFRSYYGDKNVFNFSDGLTLILGENGDGKTTFFEALQWLFNTNITKGSLDNVSEMRKSKLEIGEQDEVSVSMTFEHDGEKSVEKSFVFERTGLDTFNIGTLSFRGFEVVGSERVQTTGKNLIDRCYDAFIQKFSMFKGESELNVFNDKEALKQLVDKFSDIRKFDELVEYTKSFEEKSSASYTKAMSSDERISKEAKRLDGQLLQVNQEITNLRNEIREKDESIKFYSTRLGELESNQETSKRYKEIEDRRKTQEDKKIKIKASIESVNYNYSLLDRLWILCAYPNIFTEFKTKTSKLSRIKREQEHDFIKSRAEEIGQIKAEQKLLEEFVKLPWFVPDESHMQEMVDEHVCKVCGRPFEEGSDAHKFILEKIRDFQQHTALKLHSSDRIEKLEEKKLFEHEYIDEISHLAISLGGNNQSVIAGIAQEILDRRDLVDRLRSELAKIEKSLQDLKDEKARLIIQAGNVSEEVLEKDFKDIKGLYEQQERTGVRLVELKHKLEIKESIKKELTERMDSLDPQSSQVKVLRSVHQVLREIAKAFVNAKEDNLRRFLSELEEKANIYLEKLSISDFHGEIHLTKTANESTEIKLFSSNGTEIKKPSGSQETVMYMSVLFAISDFTQEKRDEDYPLIFDAATSSFGDVKEDDFYNVIDKVNKQCIIITKDFISKGEVRFDDIEKLNCPVYRIKKAKGFDQTNLATIRTTVEKIKE